MLRIPKTLTRHQIYGLAKHKTLQNFFDIKQKGGQAGHQLLNSEFARNLKKYPLTSGDYQNLHQKGRGSLAAYYNFYKDSWNYNTLNEFKISGIDFPIGGRRAIRLTGKLDKLELSNGSMGGNGVVVVDYKTKAPQSRNWILGKTKNSNGDYFRQLVFYKLLLDSMPRQKYNMAFGAIDFTEPDDKKRFRKESFEISDTDVKTLKETITRAADEIINLKFWNSRCGQKDCEYCALRDLMPGVF